MATSLIRGRYVICEAGTDASSSRVIADGAVFQRDGVIDSQSVKATEKGGLRATTGARRYLDASATL